VNISDPVQAAGAAVLDQLLPKLTTERGAHLESVAVALGALAGRACQGAVLSGMQPAYADLSLMVVTGANGQRYYYGDAINAPLVESENSVWNIVAAAATHLGGTLPDMNELFAHAAASVGTDDFGVPRYAKGTFSEPPHSFLPLWDEFLPTVSKGAAPDEYPQVYAVALGDLFVMVAGRFDLQPLVRIAMDSAIAMAKLATD
jgi:hypothetical protein